ncbi:MAG: hypothetical protein JJE10_03335 [Thermoleophilia bacterium]|nr:hypothetical protein [Thermoleophilia bacterium]
MNKRTVTLETHNAIVMATAPLLMVVPFLLSFSPGIGLASFFSGCVLIGVALSDAAPAELFAGIDRNRLPVAAHADFDRALGAVIIGLGIAAGIAGGQPLASIFLVGFGAAHMAHTAITRYSARGAS